MKISGRFVGASDTSEELAEWLRLQQKNWVCRIGKVPQGPQSRQLKGTPEFPLPNGKGQSHQFKLRGRKLGGSQDE